MFLGKWLRHLRQAGDFSSAPEQMF